MRTVDELFKKGNEVIEILEQNGHQAYFVGGCVRDRLLHRPVTDIDLCTSARPEEVLMLFPIAIPTGIQHGTVSVMWHGIQIEVTTFRRDGKYQDLRHPEHVHYVTTLIEDVQRRDFTINAMAMDKEGHIIDCIGGKEDLQHKLIRTVGKPRERFEEDALRMIRAIRFSAQLGFEIETNTYQEIKQCKELLHSIAAERVSMEFQKIIKAEWTKIGLHLLVDTGISQVIFPFRLISSALEQITAYPLQLLNESERWSLLLTLVGDEEKALSFLRNQVLPKQIHKQIKQWVRKLYQSPNYISAEQFSPVELIGLGIEPASVIVKINNLIQHKDERDDQVVETIIHTETMRLKAKFDSLPIQQKQDLAISGKELINLFPGKKQGPWIQHYLDQLVKLVAIGKIKNEREALIAYILECEQDECE